MRLNEIYIKRGHNKATYSDKELELFKKIESLKTKDLSEFENNSNDEVTPNSYRMLESLANQLKKEREEEVLAGTDEFWIFKNIEDSNEDYISLHDFLSEATYIGRYFRRTEPLNESRNFMIEKGNFLVLYNNNNTMIALNDSKNKERRYFIITPKYIEDGNFEFYGEVNDEYRDVEELTMDITKEINKKQIKYL